MQIGGKMDNKNLRKISSEYAGRVMEFSFGELSKIDIINAYEDGANGRNREVSELKDYYQSEVKRLEEENAELKAQIEKIQENLKADLIANLKERMQYSTSPSCTKGMELFIRSIEEWEIKENDGLRHEIPGIKNKSRKRIL